MGQHGDHPIGQVHAGSPPERLRIQSRAFLHIVRHISDMHAQMIGSVLPVQAHRIIQILRILPIDGHHGKVAQVHAVGQFRQFFGFFLCRCGRMFRLPKHFLWKTVRNPAAFYNGKNIHARIIDMPQNLRNPSFRASSLSAVVRNLHNHLGTCNRTARFFLRNKNIPSKPAVIRNHKAEASVLLEGTDHLRHSPRKNPDHLRFLPSAGIAAEQSYLHRILMTGAVGLCRRDEQIFSASLHLHESKALLMADEGPDHRRHGRNRIPPPPVHLNLSFQQKLLQQPFQLRPFLCLYLHQAGQLLFLHGNVGRLLHERNDFLFSVFFHLRVLLIRQSLPSISCKKVCALMRYASCARVRINVFFVR